MNIIPVNREDIPKTTARSNSASAKLFNDFLESDTDVARIDLDGKKHLSVRSSLTTYIKRHGIPVRVFGRGTDLYLERLDGTEELSELTEEG